MLRNLYERLNYLRNLEDKKTQVLAGIEEQGKLTEELKKADPGSTDPGGCGGFIPSLPPKTPYQGYHCKGKRPGAFGEYHSAADDGQVPGGGSESVSV